MKGYKHYCPELILSVLGSNVFLIMALTKGCAKFSFCSGTVFRYVLYHNYGSIMADNVNNRKFLSQRGNKLSHGKVVDKLVVVSILKALENSVPVYPAGKASGMQFNAKLGNGAGYIIIRIFTELFVTLLGHAR